MRNNETNEYIKEVKKEYYKNWRAKNKDKIQGYNSKYWKKRAENIKQNKFINK